MNALNQVLGGMTQIWLNVAFIACVFVVIAFRPERIRNLSLFQVACLLFALSLIIPGIGAFFLDEGRGTGRALANELSTMVKVMNLLPQLLFASAFVLAVNSLVNTGGNVTED